MIKPSVKQMLEIGSDCGLDSISEAYHNYVSHYGMFFCLEKLNEQMQVFNKELSNFGIDDTPDMLIEDALRLLND